MKRIYLTLMLMASLATASFAQMGPNNKDIDFGLRIISPIDSMPNANFGDSMFVAFEITNNGTLDIDYTQGDVLFLYLTSEIFGEEVYEQGKFITLGLPDDFTLAVGQKDTLHLINSMEGSNLNNGGEIDYTNDSKICYKLAGFGATWGVDSAGDSTAYFFDDSGFDGAAWNAWINAGGASVDSLFASFSADNISEATVYFGSGERDICLNGFVGIADVNAEDGIGMTVYPNPVSNNQLNLTYTTNTNAKVSVKIVDLTGRVVATQDLGQVNTGTEYFKVNVANLSSGMYMLEAVSDKGNRQVIKFTKK